MKHNPGELTQKRAAELAEISLREALDRYEEARVELTHVLTTLFPVGMRVWVNSPGYKGPGTVSAVFGTALEVTQVSGSKAIRSARDCRPFWPTEHF